MCHLLLLMPLFGLPVFWLMPLSFALPIYLVIAILSILMFWYIVKSMNKRVEVGLEGLIGAEARVISCLNKSKNSKYLVQSKGELWSAYSTDLLQPGEIVRIESQSGIKLLVKRQIKDKSNLVADR